MSRSPLTQPKQQGAAAVGSGSDSDDAEDLEHGATSPLLAAVSPPPEKKDEYSIRDTLGPSMHVGSEIKNGF